MGYTARQIRAFDAAAERADRAAQADRIEAAALGAWGGESAGRAIAALRRRD